MKHTFQHHPLCVGDCYHDDCLGCCGCVIGEENEVSPGACAVCGDEDDHDGVPHSIALEGDGKSKMDKRLLEFGLWEEDSDPRCVCGHAFHLPETDHRCKNHPVDPRSEFCTPCIFGCLD